MAAGRAGRALFFAGMSATTLARPKWHSDQLHSDQPTVSGEVEIIGAWKAVRVLTRPSAVISSALIGGITEAAWIGAHLVLYPLGTRREAAVKDHLRVDDLAPITRGRLVGDIEAAGTPVLLVHGLVDNRSVFTVLRRALRRRGFGYVMTVNYSVFTQDVRLAALELGEAVDRLCDRTGHERIHIIGHSLGGLIAPRSWTSCAQTQPYCANSSKPHRAALPRSWPSTPTSTTNVLVHGVGHMSLPFDLRVARMVAEHLWAHI